MAEIRVTQRVVVTQDLSYLGQLALLYPLPPRQIVVKFRTQSYYLVLRAARRKIMQTCESQKAPHETFSWYVNKSYVPQLFP